MVGIMTIKINWLNTVCAAVIAIGVLAFPFVNPCQTETSKVCAYSSEESSFTNFYGIQLGGN